MEKIIMCCETIPPSTEIECSSIPGSVVSIRFDRLTEGQRRAFQELTQPMEYRAYLMMRDGSEIPIKLVNPTPQSASSTINLVWDFDKKNSI